MFIRLSFKGGRKHIKFIPTRDTDKEIQKEKVTENIQRLRDYIKGEDSPLNSFNNLDIDERGFKEK